MKTPIPAMVLMALLAAGLAAFGWWQLGGIPFTEHAEHEHVEYDD